MDYYSVVYKSSPETYLLLTRLKTAETELLPIPPSFVPYPVP